MSIRTHAKKSDIYTLNFLRILLTIIVNIWSYKLQQSSSFINKRQKKNIPYMFVISILYFTVDSFVCHTPAYTLDIYIFPFRRIEQTSIPGIKGCTSREANSDNSFCLEKRCEYIKKPYTDILVRVRSLHVYIFLRSKRKSRESFYAILCKNTR